MRDVRLLVPFSLLGLIACGVVATGCGSNDCTETATCAAPMDGSTGSDGIAVDVGTEGSGGDSGTSSQDSGSSDAMTVRDVAFIDASSCPTGSQCVDAVPAGWTGPVILSDQTSGPPAPTPPACPPSYPTH